MLVEYKSKHKGTIPKFAFPGLLRKALDKMENAGGNLRAGFRATGIHPLNRFRVLKQLPAPGGEAGKNADDSWSTAFVDVLKEARFGNEPVVQKRKKRIQVEPGQTVKVEDLKQHSSEDEESRIKHKKDIGKSASNAKKEKDSTRKENEEPQVNRKKGVTNTAGKTRGNPKRPVEATHKRPTKKPRI